MSRDAHTPAERADAVLRAAEAAAAAAQAAAAAAQAASLPAPAEPAPADAPPPPPEPEPAAAEPPPPEPEPAAAEPPVHAAGAPARLLAAAGELEARVAQAHAQLDALESALARVERRDRRPE